MKGKERKGKERKGKERPGEGRKPHLEAEMGGTWVEGGIVI